MRTALVLVFTFVSLLPAVSADNGMPDVVDCHPPIAETVRDSDDVVSAALSLDLAEVIISSGTLGGNALMRWTLWIAQCVI